jgi:hypothetical protein
LKTFRLEFPAAAAATEKELNESGNWYMTVDLETIPIQPFSHSTNYILYFLTSKYNSQKNS